MSQILYCDFPNGQRVHVKRIADLLPYALEFGTPIRVVTQSRTGDYSSPRFYKVIKGRMVKCRTLAGLSTIRALYDC